MIERLVATARTWLLSDPYRLTLLLLTLLYVVLFTRMAFDLHAGMRTHKADLGQIDQAIWNSSRGHFLEQTDNGFIATRLTDHVEPILVLISPVLWLWDDVRALLLLQVIFVAIGALPLYLWRYASLRNYYRNGSDTDLGDRTASPTHPSAGLWPRDGLSACASAPVGRTDRVSCCTAGGSPHPVGILGGRRSALGPICRGGAVDGRGQRGDGAVGRRAWRLGYVA